jgi:CBS domain-containing protein
MTRHAVKLARHVMQHHVLQLDPGMPIERAIEAFEENEIGGAPVVDASNRLVGILTTSDVTRSEHVRSGRIQPTRGEWSMIEPRGETEEDGEGDLILGMEDYTPAVRATETVEDWMSSGVVTVDPDASLVQVCREMMKHRIHRVVVARGNSIVGIITSFDIVRCVAESGTCAGMPSPCTPDVHE